MLFVSVTAVRLDESKISRTAQQIPHPTKAALSNLADCLYLDLHELGLGVSLVSPGFVQTPLTAQNTFHMPALISPEQAAHAIVKGWAQGRFEIHFPKRFTWWLRLLRLLPDPWYFAVIRRALK